MYTSWDVAMKTRGIQRRVSLWLWGSNGGGQHPYWRTAFLGKSSVYTFVEQMAAGIVARPVKCGYSCGVLAGKVAPYGAA